MNLQQFIDSERAKGHVEFRIGTMESEHGTRIYIHALGHNSATLDFFVDGNRLDQIDGICSRCDGCGKIADTYDGEPWSAWASLPVQSSAALLVGIVKPISCPKCGGKGVFTS